MILADIFAYDGEAVGCANTATALTMMIGKDQMMAEPRICTVDGCGKGGRLKRGWCEAHYARWKRYGDPLAEGLLGRPMAFMEASIASETNDCVTWPFSRNADGYGKIRIDGRSQRAHRVVCARVHGEPPTPEHEAAHSCGKGHEGCINWRHLRWATSAENKADRVLHGTDNRGERQWQSKLTEADVLEIRQLRNAVPQREIGKRFGVSPSTVCQIQTGKTWGWLSTQEAI